METMSQRRVPDPYLVLGVPRDATPLQLARAHRRLAKEHHPDLRADEDGRVAASGRMREINEAWALLSNPTARADFDRRHPAAGTSRSGHWSPSRASITPSSPTSTRSWATWRATADETRTAPRTVRHPGEVPIPRTRRPPRPRPLPSTFRDSAWAAILVAALAVLLLLGAIAVGRLGP